MYHFALHSSLEELLIMEDGAAAEAEDALSARAVMQQQPNLRGFKALVN